jgi:hypothetical protein
MTAIVRVTPAELAVEAAEVRAACQQIEAMQITSQADLDGLTDGLREVKKRLKFLEASRRAQTDPLEAELETIRAPFRPVESAYKALEASAKARTARHVAETRQAQQAAQAAAGEAFAAGNATAGHAALARIPQAADLGSGISVREVWDFEITDPNAVARELCSPDPVKIRALTTPRPGAASMTVPGIRWFKKPQTSVRAK